MQIDSLSRREKTKLYRHVSDIREVKGNTYFDRRRKCSTTQTLRFPTCLERMTCEAAVLCPFSSVPGCLLCSPPHSWQRAAVPLLTTHSSQSEAASASWTRPLRPNHQGYENTLQALERDHGPDLWGP